MARLLYRDSFYSDLAELWEHVAQDNPDAADRLVDWLFERCALLTPFPEGRARPDIHPECSI